MFGDELLPRANLVDDAGQEDRRDETESENNLTLTRVAATLDLPPRPTAAVAPQAPQMLHVSVRAASPPGDSRSKTQKAATKKNGQKKKQQRPRGPTAKERARVEGPSLLERLRRATNDAEDDDDGSYARHVENDPVGRKYMFLLDCVLHWWKQRLAEVGGNGLIGWSCKWSQIDPMIECMINAETDAELAEIGAEV